MGCKILKSNNGYRLIQPFSSVREDTIGYVMICNPKGEVLKFFETSKTNEAYNYFNYISLNMYDKLKYWWNYKRE